MVFGGGDDILAKAFIGVGTPSKLPVLLAKSVANYTTSVRKVVRSQVRAGMILIEYFYYEPCHAHVQVDFVPGLLAHLPHGLAGNRGYALRGLVMRQSNFNPHKHLCQCHDCKHSDRLGVWLWCPSRNGLSQWQRSLKSYFKSRREDEMKPDMQRKHQGSSDLTCAQVRPMAS